MELLQILAIFTVLLAFLAIYLFMQMTNMQTRVVELEGELREAKSARPASKDSAESKPESKSRFPLSDTASAIARGPRSA